MFYIQVFLRVLKNVMETREHTMVNLAPLQHGFMMVARERVVVDMMVVTSSLTGVHLNIQQLPISSSLTKTTNNGAGKVVDFALI